MSLVSAWLLISIVFFGLWLFWRMLNFTFDLTDRAHERLRDEDRPALVSNPRAFGDELAGRRSD